MLPIHRSPNIIPVLKRFERWVYVVLGSLFVVGLVWITVTGIQAYTTLSNELATYQANQSVDVKTQIQHKQALMQQRDTIKQQQVIMRYADLLLASFSSNIPLADFLYRLGEQSSGGVYFQHVRVAASSVHIKGRAPFQDGHAAFYLFLQQLSSIPYVHRPQYQLGLGDMDDAVFTIQMEVVDAP